MFVAKKMLRKTKNTGSFKGDSTNHVLFDNILSGYVNNYYS